MKIHIITIFPEAFESYLNSSIIGRARDKKYFEPVFYRLWDFSHKNFSQVDDKAYGMHGQVLSAQPLSAALEHIFQQLWYTPPVLYMSPRGSLLQQEKVEFYSQQWGEYIIICGHYEWIDERIIEYYDVDMISIGEYVVSSGEIAALVFIDALVRHIPGVLGNKLSLEEESFSQKLNRQKEYPVYTRPEKILWLEVPSVLLSGNHNNIEKWKHAKLT